jgi:uncharacterized protein (TIGR03067 family)
MSFRLVSVIGLLGLIGATAASADDSALAAAMKKLEGTWAPIENVVDGVPTPEERLKPWRTIVKGDVYENQHEGKADTTGPLKFIAEKDGTFHLDLRPTNGPGKGKIVKCIVEFVGGDRFRLCMPAEPDGERPTEFTSKKGGLQILRTYQRVKEQPGGAEGEPNAAAVRGDK